MKEVNDKLDGMVKQFVEDEDDHLIELGNVIRPVYEYDNLPAYSDCIIIGIYEGEKELNNISEAVNLRAVDIKLARPMCYFGRGPTKDY